MFITSVVLGWPNQLSVCNRRYPKRKRASRSPYSWIWLSNHWDHFDRDKTSKLIQSIGMKLKPSRTVSGRRNSQFKLHGWCRRHLLDENSIALASGACNRCRQSLQMQEKLHDFEGQCILVHDTRRDWKTTLNRFLAPRKTFPTRNSNFCCVRVSCVCFGAERRKFNEKKKRCTIQRERSTRQVNGKKQD